MFDAVGVVESGQPNHVNSQRDAQSPIATIIGAAVMCWVMTVSVLPSINQVSVPDSQTTVYSWKSAVESAPLHTCCWLLLVPQCSVNALVVGNEPLTSPKSISA